MTIKNLEKQEKSSLKKSEFINNNDSQQAGREPTVRVLVERFKKQPDSDKLIARWQQPMPLK